VTRALAPALGLALLALGGSSIAGAEPTVAPGVQVEIVIRGLPHVSDAIELFPGELLVSAGAEAPGGRLIRFSPAAGEPVPAPGSSGEVLLWSRWRLGAITTYAVTGRIYVAVPEEGQVIQLPQLTRDLATLARWEPQPYIRGLAALRDFAFGADGRLRVADGARILETPIYVTPPVDAGQLRTVHECASACQGVAVGPNGDLFVLEADDRGGRVLARDTRGAVRVLAEGLPRPGEGLRLGRGGSLFFTSEVGLHRLSPQGHVTTVLAGPTRRARVSLDADGDLLLTDPDAGTVLRIHEDD